MEDITMAMTNRNNAKLDCMIYYTLDELVPQDHLVRKMGRLLIFGLFIRKFSIFTVVTADRVSILWFFLKCLS